MLHSSAGLHAIECGRGAHPPYAEIARVPLAGERTLHRRRAGTTRRTGAHHARLAAHDEFVSALAVRADDPTPADGAHGGARMPSAATAAVSATAAVPPPAVPHEFVPGED